MIAALPSSPPPPLGSASMAGPYPLSSVTSIHWSSSFGDQYGNGTRIIDFGTTRTTIPSIINYQSWIKPFNNSNSKNKIYVPAALVEDWKAATGWADIASHIEAHP